MICSFTTHFRPFIWFLIFTFTLYSIPCFEHLLPYKIHIFIPEAEAAVSQADESQTPPNQGEAPPDASDADQPSSKEPPAQPAAVKPDSSQLSGIPSAIFKVDDFTGAAHMTYPIAVPPGRSGLSPNLSLIYNSSGGNGWIGVGWDIPTGFIQRRGPRKGVPKYDDTKDVYELNLGGSAQELVLIGTDEYRLKIEGAYLKITYHPEPQNYWEVWDKSGIKMRFGYNTGSSGSRIGKVLDPILKRDTYRWCLDRVDDPKTNYMELIYFKDQEAGNTYQLYVQEIRYNGQVSGGLPHNHRVLFNLEGSNRPDPVYNYRGGFKMLTRKRLSSIEVKTSDALVRKYQLQYPSPSPNSRSVLSSITVYGSDGSTLPPIQFTYQTHTMGFEQQATPWRNDSVWGVSGGNCIRDTSTSGYGTYTDVIDMDGDALPDRVVYKTNCTPPYQTNCPWSVYLNKGSGFLEENHVTWPNPSAWSAINGNYIRNTATTGAGTYTDVIDMNGDGLPERVVYSKNCPSPYNNCPWNVYSNTQTGFVDDGNAEPTWPNPSAWGAINGNYIRNTNTSGYGTYTDVIDMNGDGLPDRVLYDTSCTPPYGTNCPWSVYLNNGSGFDTSPVIWPNPSAWSAINGNYIRNTGTTGAGVYTDVIDMNGDGLPDRVVYDKTSPYNMWTVYFNNGNGFDPGVDWPNPSAWGSINGNYIRSLYTNGVMADVIDMNGDGLPDRVVYCDPVLCDTWTVYFNNGSGFVSPGVAWPSPWWKTGVFVTAGNYISDFDAGGTFTAVTDINGDGLPDRVVYDQTSPYNEWSVYFNKGPVADLLKKVENGIGGSTEITYAPSTVYANTFLPFVVQTVSSYTQSDGKGNSYLYNYDYSGGFYHSGEVEFRGFHTVTSKQMANETEYESMTVTTFHQNDYYLKGKILSQVLTSAEGHTKDILNNWVEADTLGGGKFPYVDTSTTTVTDQGQGGPFTYSQTTRSVYDIRPSDLANQTFNLLEEHKNEGSPEEIVTVLEYTADYANMILSKIIKATVTDASGNIASRKWMDYNSYGELITEELCKTTTPATGCTSRNSGQNVFIYYQYDPTYKVLNQITDPRGYITTLTYDSTKTHVYETTKCLDLACTKSHTTTTEYDPGTGKQTKLIPAHLRGTAYWLQTQYDAFGRKKLERMKDNADPNTPPIVDRGSTSYTYNDTGVATTQWILKTGRIVIENAPDRTLTLNGRTYYDGMGRTYLATADGPEGRTIAVQTQFDSVGRVWKQSNPYFVGDTPYFTEYTYDGFSRLTDTLKTDGYYVHTDYEGLRKVASKQVTATNWQSKAYTYDLNQKLVEVREGFELQGFETATTYAYNILGSLIQVIAAKSGSGCPEPQGCPEKNTTTMTYDSLMRKTSMTDPDMGYWTYGYDNSGNLTSQTDAKGQTINFEYNDGLNRLTQKTYVNSNPAERVVYTYDDPAVPNSKGKLTKVSRLVGSNPEVEVTVDSVLEFDLMQRVKISKKKIESTEQTFYKGYDSAGRVVSITYPGNKTYSYEYDVAGDLLYVKDNTSGNKLVEYSDFTAMGQHRIANYPKPSNVAVKTTYSYDAPTGRLRTLLTQKLVGGTPTETYQNLDYQQFDGAGNIKILADIFNNITHNYTYDHLNRLTLAEGIGTNYYHQGYQYDRIGNITYKEDVGNYNYTYGNRPHAVNSTAGTINISLQYDNNGNMTQRAVSGGITLDITYTYDNKPNLIKKNSINHVQFTCDGNGQRVKKYNYATAQSVFYFGDLYEIRAGVNTIHVFAGNQRIASVLPDGTTQFYHKNHLDSSSVITDQYGTRKEQIEYNPFGTYRAVGNVNGTYDFDPNFPDVFYTFTGQEDDDDIGLYNYNARLYDPVLGKFISPDSIVQAPDDPQMLNRYSYARNNPLTYTDPSGQFIEEILSFVAGLLSPLVGEVAAQIAAPLILAAAGGAAIGAANAALAGGNIGLGALTGAISGVTFFAAGSVLHSITPGLTQLEQIALTTVVHAAAGAISGVINSAITGSNLGLGTLTGAVGAGIGALAGGILPKGEEFQIVGRVVAGGIAGGIVAEIYGGNFWQGFAQGAATAATAFLCNEMMTRGAHFLLEIANFMNDANAQNLANEAMRQAFEISKNFPCNQVEVIYVCFRPGPPAYDMSVGLGSAGVHTPDINCVYFEIRGLQDCIRNPIYWDNKLYWRKME